MKVWVWIALSSTGCASAVGGLDLLDPPSSPGGSGVDAPLPSEPDPAPEDGAEAPPELPGHAGTDRYFLYAAQGSPRTWLINQDGLAVHDWSHTEPVATSVDLLPDGSLLATEDPNANAGLLGLNRFNAGGAGGRVHRMSWEGETLWRFDFISNVERAHHDIEMLPNGNVLILAWEYHSRDEAIAAGRNPEEIDARGIWTDEVVEVAPVGIDGGEIVWRWRAWDHLGEGPSKLDINHEGPMPDWSHCNSVAFNAELDQIVLSSREFSELWFIDHSTTTEEAASDAGGRYGRGGDLLWRWGNPEAWGGGGPEDRTLYGQHDAQWIADGSPGAGDVLIFDNGEKRPDGMYSTVVQIAPPTLEDGSFDPDAAVDEDVVRWLWTAEERTSFYSPFISGAQRLADGTTLAVEGMKGKLSLLAPSGEVVWSYISPIPEGGEGGVGGVAGASVFRARGFLGDAPELRGRELEPGGAPE
jgi:hypothetical protein